MFRADDLKIFGQMLVSMFHNFTFSVLTSGDLFEVKLDVYDFLLLAFGALVLLLVGLYQEKTLSGIIIPDSAKEKPLRGTVLAAGKGTKDEEMVVKENDVVMFGKYAGTEIELDGEKLLIMRQSDILAIVKD